MVPLNSHFQQLDLFCYSSVCNRIRTTLQLLPWLLHPLHRFTAPPRIYIPPALRGVDVSRVCGPQLYCMAAFVFLLSAVTFSSVSGTNPVLFWTQRQQQTVLPTLTPTIACGFFSEATEQTRLCHTETHRGQTVQVTSNGFE